MNCCQIKRRRGNQCGITLLELMVVLVIIGILARIALPHMQGLGKSNAMRVASRQLLDDVNYARQKAIATRSKVYMVFLQPDFWTNNAYAWGPSNAIDAVNMRNYNASVFANPPTNWPIALNIITNLAPGQYTSYAMISPRTVGDQPGRPNVRYLTSWRHLPKGVFISTNKFANIVCFTNEEEVDGGIWITNTPFEYRKVRFPSADYGADIYMPCLVFNTRGQLETTNQDEYISLAEGSILPIEPPAITNVNLMEIPPGNATNSSSYCLIHIDAATGQAKIERPEIRVK